MAAFRQHWSRFEALDAHVLGVSVDSSATKAAWAGSLGGLPYDLLADFYPHGAVADAYGLLLPSGFAVRGIVIVDKAGIVRWERRFGMDEVPDVEEILAELERIGRDCRSLP